MAAELFIERMLYFKEVKLNKHIIKYLCLDTLEGKVEFALSTR